MNNNDEFKINKYCWQPITEIIQSVENFCIKNNFKNILEIGPGGVPFSLANKTVGYNEKIKDYIELDIDIDKLPFEDGSLDFVYCRHTMEDIQNPDFAMREIIRVSKSGYIETPSPLIEVTKGVDGPHANFAGYIHHRYIVWSDIENNTIYFLPKYSSIIDNILTLDNSNKREMYNLINKGPKYWNNYFIWKDTPPKIVMYKNGVNFGLEQFKFVEDYVKLIIQAVNLSIKNTDYFLSNYYDPRS